MDRLMNLKLKSITKKLGSIVISDDRIDCYIDNNKLEKYLKKNNNFLNLDNTYKKIGYGIDKPITYHINNYCFDGIIISTNDSIYFNNCSFIDEVTIIRADQITLEDNMYINASNSFNYNDRFFVGTNIKDFTIINERYRNEGEEYSVNMKVKASSINIIDSYLLDGVGALNLEADEINLENSIIDSESTLIQSKKVNIDDTSAIFGSKAAMIFSKNINDEERIYSPKRIIDGVRKESKEKTSHRVKRFD